jgi:hypothetical protein
VTDTGVTDTGVDAGTLDAGDAESADVGVDAGCVTTIPVLADGGVPELVQGFDTATGATTNWNPAVYNPPADGGALLGTVSYSSTVGDTCPGSIALTVPFIAYDGEKEALEYDFPGTPTAANFPLWTGVTAVHFSVKVTVESPDGGALTGDAAVVDFAGLNDEGNFAQWGNFGAATYNGSNPGTGLDFSGTSFAAGEWQNVSLVLVDATQAAADAGGFPVPSGGNCQQGNACKFAIQVETPTSVPASGPAVPPTVTVYVDDIWYELQ